MGFFYLLDPDTDPGVISLCGSGPKHWILSFIFRSKLMKFPTKDDLCCLVLYMKLTILYGLDLPQPMVMEPYLNDYHTFRTQKFYKHLNINKNSWMGWSESDYSFLSTPSMNIHLNINFSYFFFVSAEAKQLSF